MVGKECIFCGTVLDEDDKFDYVCESCNKKVEILSMLKKIDNAKDKLEKANKKYLNKNVDYTKQRNSVIEKFIKNNYKFKSTEELCFAMQLEKENIKYYSNFKIGNYSVDFLMPDIRKIVEIDGEIYHKGRDASKELLRERLINHVVGMDYEIIRIPASYVPRFIIKNAKEVMDFVVDKRNFDKREHRTDWDKDYFEQYLYLQRYLRKWGKR